MESLLGVSLSTEGAGGGGSRRGGVSWDSQGSQDYFWRLGSRSEEPRVVRVPPSRLPMSGPGTGRGRGRYDQGPYLVDD